MHSIHIKQPFFFDQKSSLRNVFRVVCLTSNIWHVSVFEKRETILDTSRFNEPGCNSISNQYTIPMMDTRRQRHVRDGQTDMRIHRRSGQMMVYNPFLFPLSRHHSCTPPFLILKRGLVSQRRLGVRSLDRRLRGKAWTGNARTSASPCYRIISSSSLWPRTRVGQRSREVVPAGCTFSNVAVRLWHRWWFQHFG